MEKLLSSDRARIRRRAGRSPAPTLPHQAAQRRQQRLGGLPAAAFLGLVRMSFLLGVVFKLDRWTTTLNHLFGIVRQANVAMKKNPKDATIQGDDGQPLGLPSGGQSGSSFEVVASTVCSTTFSTREQRKASGVQGPAMRPLVAARRRRNACMEAERSGPQSVTLAAAQQRGHHA